MSGTYRANHVIVATGARPRALPGIEPDGKLIWTYFEALGPPDMARSLIVMGSDAIGIEFASVHRTMGVDRCDASTAVSPPAQRSRGALTIIRRLHRPENRNRFSESTMQQIQWSRCGASTGCPRFGRGD
jgi:hypothetical protein